MLWNLVLRTQNPGCFHFNSGENILNSSNQITITTRTSHYTSHSVWSFKVQISMLYNVACQLCLWLMNSVSGFFALIGPPPSNTFWCLWDFLTSSPQKTGLSIFYERYTALLLPVFQACFLTRSNLFKDKTLACSWLLSLLFGMKPGTS